MDNNITIDELNRLEILGYDVLPRPHAHSPGYSGLRLLLPQKATGHDLEMVALTLVDWEGRPHVSKIYATSETGKTRSVGPGRIHVRSHHGSEGVFYAFGGELVVEPREQEKVLTITSTAPLLELSSHKETVTNLMAAEAESLIGRLEASLEWSHMKLMQQLEVAGPLAVYLAIIQSLLTMYTEATPLRQLHPELVTLLQREKEWYRRAGQWPLLPPDLQTLVTKVVP